MSQSYCESPQLPKCHLSGGLMYLIRNFSWSFSSCLPRLSERPHSGPALVCTVYDNEDAVVRAHKMALSGCVPGGPMRRAVMGCSQHCSIHSLTALGSSYSVPLLLAAGTVLEQCWNSAGALLPIAVPALSTLGTVLLVLARSLIHPSLSLSQYCTPLQLLTN